MPNFGEPNDNNENQLCERRIQPLPHAETSAKLDNTENQVLEEL